MLNFIQALQVSDLYLRVDGGGTAPAIYQGRKRGAVRVNAIVPDMYYEEIKLLTDFVMENQSGVDGMLHVEGYRFRVARQKMADGEEWVCLRVIKTQLPQFDNLGIAKPYMNALNELGRRDGLVMITGATGHGKTTTAVALLVRLLQDYGGVAVTLEDPVEYLLKGQHGKAGFCFQAEVREDSGWAPAIKRSLRWAPHYIFVGEIRTPQAAEQVLRAATTGHLVITTVHAGSPEEGLTGLMHLAEQAMGGSSATILASAITAVAHQQMMENGPSLRMVVTDPSNMGDPVRALVREGRVGMLGTYIDKMTARMRSSTVA